VAETLQYDSAVIGAGQAGVPLAAALAGSGRKTVLIERSHVGGTCVNYGCTPTKTMIASAAVAWSASRASDYGVTTGSIEVDMRRVRERKRKIVEDFRSGIEHRLEKAGVDVLRGEANFEHPGELRVVFGPDDSIRLQAGEIFINTGARPAVPPIEGLPDIDSLDSTTIMELDEVPEHLLIVGGGYVAMEFSQMFRRFGSSVTIFERGPRILGREDEDIADTMAQILAEDGIEIIANANVKRVQSADDGRIILEADTPPGERTVTGSHLLIAAGRRPNTENLNLEAACVLVDTHGFIYVDERLETGVPGIWAMGDVKPGPQFTHISYDDYRIIRTNLLEGGYAGTDARLAPYTIFTDPQLGRVGLTEQQAIDQHLDFRVARIPMSRVARAIETGATRGVAKAIVDADTGRILGCAVLGVNGGEMMAAIQIAMMGNLPYTALAEGVFAHPTLAEGLNTLFNSLEPVRRHAMA